MTSMVAHVEKTEKGYAILLTDEMVEKLHLSEGTAVEVRSVTEPTTTGPQIRYATAEEAMQMHRRLEPENAKAYTELAK